MTTRKGLTSFVANATIAAYLRVKYVAPNKVDVAGANDNEIGVSRGEITSVVAGRPVPVQLNSEPGSVWLQISGAVADGAVLYRAAGGQVSAAGTIVYGVALMAGADQDIIEVLPNAGGAEVSLPNPRTYTFTGHNGAAGINVPGLLAGDQILSVQGLTTPGDASASFVQATPGVIAVAATLVQSSAADLHLQTYLLTVAQP